MDQDNSAATLQYLIYRESTSSTPAVKLTDNNLLQHHSWLDFKHLGGIQSNVISHFLDPPLTFNVWAPGESPVKLKVTGTIEFATYSFQMSGSSPAFAARGTNPPVCVASESICVAILSGLSRPLPFNEGDMYNVTVKWLPFRVLKA